MADWVIRDYVPEDEAMCVSLWLRGYARSDDAKELHLWRAGEHGHPDWAVFRDMHRPIVTSLLRQATVTMACDPERVQHQPGRPSVVWAWLCASNGYVHWVSVKNEFMNTCGIDMASDVVKDLLGPRLEQVQRTTFLLTDLWRLRLIPKMWTRDRGWLEAVRTSALRRQDPVFRGVSLDVLEAA